jgi:hypothetical protein
MYFSTLAFLGTYNFRKIDTIQLIHHGRTFGSTIYAFEEAYSLF